MNIINLIAMNVSTLLNYAGAPIKSSYNSISVFGDNKYDYLHVKDLKLTEAEMLSVPLYTNPIWDGNTILLALFENTLSAGNVSGITTNVDYWIIQRKKTTETIYKTLAEVNFDVSSFIDLTAEPNTIYDYRVFGANDTELTEPLANTLNSNFYNHLLIDTVTKMAVVFDVNLEFGGYEPETAYERYDGFGKYSTYAIGERNFKTGSVKAIVYESMSVDGNLVQTCDYLKTIDAFLNNGNNKIMKDRKGNVLLVKTLQGMVQSPVNINIKQQPYEITFNFEEAGEVDV